MQIWNSTNYNLVGSIPSPAEVRSLVVSADLVYLGSRNGAVEIWSREKLIKIGALQAGGPGCRVQCMAVDADGDVLVVGTSDGRIQVWFRQSMRAAKEIVISEDMLLENGETID
jgi:WD40 repeat protein